MRSPLCLVPLLEDRVERGRGDPVAVHWHSHALDTRRSGAGEYTGIRYGPVSTESTSCVLCVHSTAIRRARPSQRDRGESNAQRTKLLEEDTLPPIHTGPQHAIHPIRVARGVQYLPIGIRRVMNPRDMFLEPREEVGGTEAGAVLQLPGEVGVERLEFERGGVLRQGEERVGRSA
jgi:hypothetical protein